MRLWSKALNTVVAGALAAALALTGVTGAVFAQERGAAAQPSTAAAAPTTQPGPQSKGGGGSGWLRPLAAMVADALQMKVEDVTAARRAGKSFVQIAADRGVSEAQLLDSLRKQAKARLGTLVSNGKMTKDQAEHLLAIVKARLKAALNRVEVGPQGTGAVTAIRRGAREGFVQGYQRGWKQGFQCGLRMRVGLGRARAGRAPAQQRQNSQNQTSTETQAQAGSTQS